MILIYNGKELNETEFHVGCDNRAFTYGDGVFETIIASPHKISFLTDHITRLTKGINALGMIAPAEINLSAIEKFIQSLITKNQIEKEARIKILVWRKSEGLFTPSGNESEFIITASSHTQPLPVKEKVLFYKDIRLVHSPVSRFKTLSSLPYVMAGIAKTTLQADDLILFDTEDHVAECLISNIFWIKDEKVFTPSIETGCKEGIMRKQILDYLNKSNIKWEEGKFRKEDLLQANLIFTSNVAGIIPLRKVEDKIFPVVSDLFIKIRSALT